MTLSVGVMTRGPGARVAAMLSLFRPVANEILVALDDRASPEVEGALGAVADRLIHYPYAEPVDRPLGWIHAECESDWVLTVDDDEIPGRALLDALPGLVQAGDVTHYWLSRRWLFPTADRYLDARPWRPDYQPRLVLNDARVLSFPDETHVPVRVLGPSRYVSACLYHADTVLNSTEAREAKAARYERLRPGKRVAGRPLNEAFYVPERVDAPTREVPAEDAALIATVLAAAPQASATIAETAAASRGEVDRHWAGRTLGDAAYEAGLALLEELPVLRAGVEERVDVEIENRGDELWPWGGAGGPAIRIASRWTSRETVLEGAHVPLPADLPPGAGLIVPLPLVPPGEGRWTLMIDLVHEHVRRFGQPLEVEIDVRPHRLVAVLDPGSSEGLLEALATLEPEEEPVVVTDRLDELARGFAGRIAASLPGTGARRLVVPDGLVRAGRRRPLLAALAAARKLRIPVHTVSGAPLTAVGVVRRRLR